MINRNHNAAYIAPAHRAFSRIGVAALVGVVIAFSSSARATERMAVAGNDAGIADAAVGDAAVGDAAAGKANSGASSAKLPSWAPSVEISVRPTKAHLGDPLHAKIVVHHGEGVSVNLPVKLDLGDFVELARHQAVQQQGKPGQMPQARQVFELELAAYKLGKLTLPPIELSAVGPAGQLLTLETKPVTIELRSVMPNEPNPKLKALEPPVPLYVRTWWLLYALGGLVALAVVVVTTLLIARRVQARRRAERPSAPPRPAHEVALEKLDALPIDEWLDELRFKELYQSLSEILRWYVGERWHFDALEMTTTEITEALQRARVTAETQDRLQRFFADCDLVKFAKVDPGDEGARTSFREAHAIVRQTIPQTGSTAVSETVTDDEGRKTETSAAADGTAPSQPDTADPGRGGGE